METDTKRLQNTVLEAMSPCAGCQENNEKPAVRDRNW